MSFIKNKWEVSKFGEKLENESVSRAMNDKSIWIKDVNGREIIINPTAGIKAKDADENILHDIADCVQSSGFYYLGHLYLYDQPTQVLTFSSSLTSGSGSRYVDFSQQTNITTYLPYNITNITGIYLEFYFGLDLYGLKGGVENYILTQAFYTTDVQARSGPPPIKIHSCGPFWSEGCVAPVAGLAFVVFSVFGAAFRFALIAL
jgi:hypothetical protein